MKRICVFLLLTACGVHSVRDQDIVQTLSPRKQRSRIAHLEKRLAAVEAERERATAAALEISNELEEARLALIRRQVDDYEASHEKPHALFLQEREALYAIIQQGPGPAALAAQAELERILRLITEYGATD